MNVSFGAGALTVSVSMPSPRLSTWDLRKETSHQDNKDNKNKSADDWRSPFHFFSSDTKLSNMNIKIYPKFLNLVMIAFLSLIMVEQSRAQDWRGLIPMQSNRKDVENLLGKPEKNIKGFGKYKNKDETVSVWYSIGNCKTKQGLNWNVGEDTVTAISIRFEKETSLDSLKWDISKFSKRNHPRDESRFFLPHRMKI